jgi:(1->4)-alpha-D-glucan 1-alpha-D-glucosylmutase
MLRRCGQQSFEAALSDEACVAKLWLLNRLLRLRRTLPEALGRNGHYRPLLAAGRFADLLVGFQRGDALVTIVPRWLRRLTDGWHDTTCELPVGRWVDLLTEQRWSGGTVSCQSLFARFQGVLLRRC